MYSTLKSPILDKVWCCRPGCTDCSTKPKKCAGCKVMRYCSTACQALDWPEHKKVCAELGSRHIVFMKEADEALHVPAAQSNCLPTTNCCERVTYLVYDVASVEQQGVKSVGIMQDGKVGFLDAIEENWSCKKCSGRNRMIASNCEGWWGLCASCFYKEMELTEESPKVHVAAMATLAVKRIQDGHCPYHGDECLVEVDES